MRYDEEDSNVPIYISVFAAGYSFETDTQGLEREFQSTHYEDNEREYIEVMVIRGVSSNDNGTDECDYLS